MTTLGNGVPFRPRSAPRSRDTDDVDPPYDSSVDTHAHWSLTQVNRDDLYYCTTHDRFSVSWLSLCTETKISPCIQNRCIATRPVTPVSALCNVLGLGIQSMTVLYRLLTVYHGVLLGPVGYISIDTIIYFKTVEYSVSIVSQIHIFSQKNVVHLSSAELVF